MAVMHLSELWDVMGYINTMRRKGLIPEASIETIDVDKEELIPLNDFVKRLGAALP